MPFALAQALLLADAITPDALGQALHVSATRGASLVRALQALGTLDPARLEQQLEKGDPPAMRHVSPVVELVERLPPGLCERLLVLPVRQDPRTGTVDVAVVDARDPHAAEEVGFWLGAPVRLVRTSFASMDAAFRRLEEKPSSLGMQALAPPIDTRESPPLDEGPAAGPNIPIPLTRRNAALPDGTPASVPAAPPRDPVLDLQKRKAPPAPESVAPTTQRGPFSPAPRAVAPPETAPAVDVVAELRAARDRDAIVELLLTGARRVAGRVAVLAVRRDSVVGWACSPEIADPATFRKVRVPTGTPTVLTEVLEQGGAWLARFPRDLAHAPLLDLLRVSPSDEVAIAGVRVEGRAALVVLAAGLGGATQAKKELGELASEAGEALARLLRERRK